MAKEAKKNTIKKSVSIAFISIYLLLYKVSPNILQSIKSLSLDALNPSAEFPKLHVHLFMLSPAF